MTLFQDLLYLLIDIFNALMTFGSYIFGFLTFELGFGDYTLSIGTILFGAGFTAWIIYISLPVT